MSDTVHVAVAVIVNNADEVCISLRHQDAHQGGLWEFPGGKLEKNESAETALVREINEELNLKIKGSRPLITITHDYIDKKVCLHVRKVSSYSGVAIGAENQSVKWVPIDSLSDYEFPAANAPIIKALQLPEKYLITGNFTSADDCIKKLSAALKKNIRLVQLRLKPEQLDNIDDPKVLVHKVFNLCQQENAQLMLNIPQDLLETTIGFLKMDFVGIHADSSTLMTLSSRPDCGLFSASCHNVAQLEKAAQLKADFVVLSPVQKTTSHPGAVPIGWLQFEDMAKPVSVPVYALGGVSSEHIGEAWSRGGQGVAAISAFWDVE